MPMLAVLGMALSTIIILFDPVLSFQVLHPKNLI
jgi:hypothetical protein